MSEGSILHLGCGENRIEKAVNVDIMKTAATDRVVDLNETPWPFNSGAYDHIVAEHVLEHLDSVDLALHNCARVLRQGGTLRVAWPVGLNQDADPDHEHRWTWKTPEFFCGERPWDADVGLRVKSKDVRLWSEYHGPLRSVHNAYLHAKERGSSTQHWKFSEPATSGEFVVVFEKP